MVKLYELVSQQVGKKFNLTVGTTTREFTLERFTLAKMIEYEKKGHGMDSLMELMTKQPATWATQIGWDLLKEKDEFNNDLNVFRELLDIPALNALGEALTDTLEDSRPEPKNVEGVQTQK